jgi:hypothetical protein
MRDDLVTYDQRHAKAHERIDHRDNPTRQTEQKRLELRDHQE